MCNRHKYDQKQEFLNSYKSKQITHDTHMQNPCLPISNYVKYIKFDVYYCKLIIIPNSVIGLASYGGHEYPNINICIPNCIKFIKNHHYRSRIIKKSKKMIMTNCIHISVPTNIINYHTFTIDFTDVTYYKKYMLIDTLHKLNIIDIYLKYYNDDNKRNFIALFFLFMKTIKNLELNDKMLDVNIQIFKYIYAIKIENITKQLTIRNKFRSVRNYLNLTHLSNIYFLKFVYKLIVFNHNKPIRNINNLNTVYELHVDFCYDQSIMQNNKQFNCLKIGTIHNLHLIEKTYDEPYNCSLTFLGTIHTLSYLDSVLYYDSFVPNLKYVPEKNLNIYKNLKYLKYTDTLYLDLKYLFDVNMLTNVRTLQIECSRNIKYMSLKKLESLTINDAANVFIALHVMVTKCKHEKSRYIKEKQKYIQRKGKHCIITIIEKCYNLKRIEIKNYKDACMYDKHKYENIEILLGNKQ